MADPSSNGMGGGGGGGGLPSSSSSAAPTIKNHSVTHFGRYLYCFGGYDGRRNHMTLLLYDLKLRRWIRPTHENSSSSSSSSAVSNANPNFMVERSLNDEFHAIDGNINNNILHNHGDIDESAADDVGAAAAAAAGVVGGLGGSSDAIIVQGTPPPGRNGHSATLAAEDEDNGRIFIIGGWLGTGPLAASDMHVLDVSAGGRLLRWYQHAIKGTPPGPCNMHSADYVPNNKEVYVFRGGNGREYLNDLHALNVQTLTWRQVVTTGEIPQQRANHSSAMLEETNELFIFGGWNGTERLNDIHILDTATSTWSRPKMGGVLPHPRAGMTLTALRGRLYLFGGSGTSAKCFQDLQILDRQEMAWLDVSQYDDNGNYNNANNSSISSSGRSHHHFHSNNANNNNHYDPQFCYGGIGRGGHEDAPQHGGPHNRGYGARYTPNAASGHDSPFGYGQYGDVDSASLVAISQQGGTQEGSGTSSNAAFALSDWRSRDIMASSMRAGSGDELDGHHDNGNNLSSHNHRHHRYNYHASPNPNDEDSVPSVLIYGHGPGRRAGHTATAVNRHIYVFGGSCGSDYLNDFFVLDTDPPPRARVSEPTSLQLFERRLRHFFNDEEFADVTFVVQGRKVYGHKMVLSIVSDCFRAMFTTGFRESDEAEIEIPDCSHRAFLNLMEYIYTGALPNMELVPHHNVGHGQLSDLQRGGHGGGTSALGDRTLVHIIEMLELADRFFLDHLKQICEYKLQPAVNADTVEYLLSVAQKRNAGQLQEVCEHFLRNHDSTSVPGVVR
jgi:BTB/POZ domain/Kelch motif/Galactose oxidase, central domain